MIDEAAAITFARQRAEENGWAFAEPVSVTLRRGWFGGASHYVVETGFGQLGSKAHFKIEAESGVILEEGYLAR